jgi:thymidylate synthase ThyX
MSVHLKPHFAQGDGASPTASTGSLHVVDYPKEAFTEDERAKLSNHFTNLESPVFALINLPETVKGALFARYSRYQGTLRRLFLDEFADGLPDIGELPKLSEGRRAAELYERVFIGFGDDSVAQLGGAHIACEWTSNVMTKILQRPRLAAYLEQSTRYIPYDHEIPGGGFRYYRHPALGVTYEAAMDELFSTYSRLLPKVTGWLDLKLAPRGRETTAERKRYVRAKTLDLLRGILPASSLSHMGIFASGQAYESLVLHLLAHPLPEARRYGGEILQQLEAVIPSFVARVERPDRGGRSIHFLQERRKRSDELVRKYQLDERDKEQHGPSVELLDVQGDEAGLLESMLFESSSLSERKLRDFVASLSPDKIAGAIKQLIGPRSNRRHKPGRGFERIRYRFEIVSDYAAFRDLQRHRLLTIQWQALNPDLGFHAPPELQEAGVYEDFLRAIEISKTEYDRLHGAGQEWAAPYALCLAFRVRYVMDMSAREAMHIVELRSRPEGHASYRLVAQQMHEQILRHHPAVAEAMNFTDLSREDAVDAVEETFIPQGQFDLSSSVVGD